jgi:hypothetical protein
MLYGGLNQISSLNALLEHLKNPAKIQKICDFNIIFLEPLSPSYGDLFADEVDQPEFKKSKVADNFFICSELGR